ncbi:hydrocephalus-inducing protein-like [Melospiza melodia melodia]|uniref:hydrocephalus-inducing protein-like n=1 Tax=Melospiza melodia melodia TaxID=1914991 RepID=UPI002FD064B6
MRNGESNRGQGQSVTARALRRCVGSCSADGASAANRTSVRARRGVRGWIGRQRGPAPSAGTGPGSMSRQRGPAPSAGTGPGSMGRHRARLHEPAAGPGSIGRHRARLHGRQQGWLSRGLRPGRAQQPRFVPGSLAPGKKRLLKFSYMPGLPGAFSRTYQLKVGDLEPENICLKGEASFPMISLDLPWNIRGNEKYEKILKQLIKPLQQDNQRNKSVVLKKTQSLKTKTLESQTLKTQTTNSQTLKTQNPKTQDLQPSVLASGTVSDTQLQIEMMRMLIEKAALELQQKLSSYPLKNRFPDKELCQSLVKVELPQYVLDMGPVLKGYTESHSLKITNPGQIHVSFQVDVSVLQDTGFSVGLDQMICLPPNNSVDFDVRFESAHKPYGDVEVVLPIEVTKGPMYSIRICATVSELSLTLSKNRLQFSDILVGDCQVETIQLYNRFPESCKWFIASKEPALRVKHRRH